MSSHSGFTALTPIILVAGTATAGTAPLKLTSGTSLTAAEAGAMEYNGTSLFITDSVPTRRTLLYTDFSNQNTSATPTFGAISTSGLTSNDQVIISATAGSSLVVGRNGTTNPVFNVDASTTSAATGLNIKGAAAAGGVALSVISSGTNENLIVTGKGSGTISLNTLVIGSTGIVTSGTWNATAIDHAYLSGIVQADVGGLTTASTPTFAGLALGTGNLSTVGNIAVDGTAARDITVGRTAGTTGNNLTVTAGGAVSGGTNTAGGALFLQGGTATGNSSSAVQFYVAGGGGSGTSDKAPTLQAILFTRSASLPTLALGAAGNTTTGLPLSSNVFAISGQAAGGLYSYRTTTSATAGFAMTIQAGGAVLSGTDKNGGTLILSSGISTGTGTSTIQFNVATPQGSTNTTDNAPASVLTLTNSAFTFGEALNIVLGTTTGTKIGTATTQKLGFFNATPIVQGTAFTQTYSTASHTHANITASAPPAGGTGATAGAYDTSAHRDAMITSLTNNITDVANVKQVLNGLIDDLQALGLIA